MKILASIEKEATLNPMQVQSVQVQSAQVLSAVQVLSEPEEGLEMKEIKVQENDDGDDDSFKARTAQAATLIENQVKVGEHAEKTVYTQPCTGKKTWERPGQGEKIKQALSKREKRATQPRQKGGRSNRGESVF